MKKDRIEEYDIKRKLLNEWIAQQFKLQQELMLEILKDGNEICGLVGSVKGENGFYDVESIYLEKGSKNSEQQIMCHLDYPSFETDVCFDDLSVAERQQIIELAVKLLKELKSHDDYATDKQV